jgi:hypothetical protein
MTMADESNTPAGTGDAATNGQGPAVALQTVYIKDLSFEAPKGPFMPAQAQQDPKISLNLSTMSSNIGQDAHEVVLSVTLEGQERGRRRLPRRGEAGRRLCRARVRRRGDPPYPRLVRTEHPVPSTFARPCRTSW